MRRINHFNVTRKIVVSGIWMYVSIYIKMLGGGEQEKEIKREAGGVKKGDREPDEEPR